jgi:hypothetical protein
MTADPKYSLRQLRAAMQSILDAIDPADSPYPDEAVNYTDLRCVAAYRCEDHDGVITYHVDVSEASSDAERFQDYVKQRLASAGFVDVEVRTEW